jgi:hypothetical protein
MRSVHITTDVVIVPRPTLVSELQEVIGRALTRNHTYREITLQRRAKLSCHPVSEFAILAEV